MNDRNLLIFVVASIFICIPLSFYYQYANPFLMDVGVENATGIMTLGQLSEALFMLLIPFFLVRFGLKKTLLVGMLSWAGRHGLCAYGNSGERVFILVRGIALPR